MIKSKIKICGIKNIDTIKCCIKNNIKFFGLMFYKKSPRFIKYNDAIKLINYSKNKNIYPVGVFVNESIDNINKIIKILKINYIQLHGDEDNFYIKSLKKKNNLRIIKNIPIKTSKDFKNTSKYPNADFFLFDYKPLKKELPGGNAKSFNWTLIKNIKLNKPWFLSGGISIDNIKEIKNYAIPYGIDISSGVEDKRGIKSNYKITSLVELYDSK